MNIDFEKLEYTPLLQRNQTVWWINLWPPVEPVVSIAADAMQIKATTGLGKTQAAISLIANDPWFRKKEIHFYTPDHKHSDEVAKQARAHGLRVVVMAGRTLNSDSPGYCARYKVTDKVAKAGLNVYRTCCQGSSGSGRKTCPFFEECPYLKQWADDKPAFRIFNHVYVFLPKPKRDGEGLPEAALAIVDESVVQKSVEEHSFHVDRLEDPFLEAANEHLQNSSDFQTALTERNVDALWAWDCAEACDPEGQREIHPETDEKEALKKLDEITQKEALGVTAFYRAIAKEIEFERPIQAIRIARDEKVRVNGQNERQNRVHVFTLKECFISPATPIIILDADASLELNQKVFGRNIISVEIHAKQNAEVIQVYSTSLSNYKLLIEKTNYPALEKVSAIVARETKRGGRVLVIMPKNVEIGLSISRQLEVRNKTNFWHGAEVAHFGAIRGKDCWKGFDTVVIIGRNEPPGKAVDVLMRGLFSDEAGERDFIGEKRFPKQPRGYRLKDQSNFGVKTSVHPDPLGQLLLEQIRESETTQAIGRLRLVHAEKPKRVVIICSVPVDMTVDELVTLDELAGTPGRTGPIGRLRLAMDQVGILPLGARDLACAFPKIFPSKSSANDALKALSAMVRGGTASEPHSDLTSGATAPQGCGRQVDPSTPDESAQLRSGLIASPGRQIPTNGQRLNGGEYQIEYLLGVHPHYRRATYRRAGQRGKASKALIDTSRHSDPKFALSELLGQEIAMFEMP